MGTPVTEEEFRRLLASPKQSAFRLETRTHYALGYEREFFTRFCDGEKPEPPDYDWYRTWLEKISSMTTRGIRVERVRILNEPPTDYQRSEIWTDPWHAKAGEVIRYLSRSNALEIGLPLEHDWWLLDDERLIDMRFTDTGEIAGKTLITGQDMAAYRAWRDLADRYATTADAATAA